MASRITDIAGGLQVATLSTFVDFNNILGLGVINFGSVYFRAAILPMLGDRSPIGFFLSSCVEGTIDLAKWYYLRNMAQLPVSGAGAVMGP